jgi:hypothetical protein
MTFLRILNANEGLIDQFLRFINHSSRFNNRISIFINRSPKIINFRHAIHLL